MIEPTHVIILDEVADDLSEGKTFYSMREIWLGEYFWDSVLSDIESLYLFAGIHQVTFGYYRLLSKRFPYAIYYDIDDKIVQVVAVLPVRRDPIWIESRLTKRG
ncbi:MAG TPA: type II toxin-antitoxin system RelE/ParE family toxin [Deltaproteobacteria bacterium]|nr:type II toxin-antitoxin system RelE/ParE family toxin [Deltaproteobacteria bacterium]